MKVAILSAHESDHLTALVQNIQSQDGIECSLHTGADIIPAAATLTGETSLVVFFHHPSNEPPTHEPRALAYLSALKVPCIMIYRNRHRPPSYLPSDHDYEIECSFIPEPAFGFAEGQSFNAKKSREYSPSTLADKAANVVIDFYKSELLATTL